MSPEELSEFLAAMELARRANAAFSEVAWNLVDENDDLDQNDLDQDDRVNVPYESIAVH